MKKLLVILFSIFSLSSYAQKQTFSVEEVREDMAVLKRKFEKLHPGMYYYKSKKEYNQIYDSLYNSLTQPLTYLEAYRVLAQLVTAVEDGHTNIRFDSKRFHAKKVKYVPFFLRRINDKYYLSINASRDSTIVRGSEVIRINNEPVENLINKLKTFVSSDNDNEETKEYYATALFSSFYLRQYGEIDSVTINYRLPFNNTIFRKKLACLTNGEINKISDMRYKTFKRPNLAVKIVDSLNHIAVLDITSFSMTGKFMDFRQKKFKRGLRNSFKRIKEKGIEHLIVDFRANGGGYIPNISRLMKYLSPTPFTIIDTIAFKKSAYFTIAKPYYISPPLVFWMGFPKRKGDFMYRVNKQNDNNKPIKDLAYKGKTYFLTDPGCYSATTFTLNLAKDMGIGQAFIGQTVGGASWGSFAGSWENFKLPHTKYVIHTPLYKITHRLPNQKNKGFFLDLDYEVNRNYEELLKNNTSVIDFTVDMIRASKAAVSR
ncbi:S41 family peptidase [Emticicia agri]|uniref:Tail specific protease domain-containing protein n=1 Tax=Emticicia agri TaxID=2492393 RepID=A0A4Q5LVG2_9BACT|nr:S41 family peptidase [Emticicia agri]RYU93662.1 hypothetical protein EWM59_20720 [Emticicia agri]